MTYASVRREIHCSWRIYAHAHAAEELSEPARAPIHPLLPAEPPATYVPHLIHLRLVAVSGRTIDDLCLDRFAAVGQIFARLRRGNFSERRLQIYQHFGAFW